MFEKTLSPRQAIARALCLVAVLLPSLAAAQTGVPPPGVDPMRFGARCDGASDDAAALAAAIRSAKAGGQPVQLPAATCAYASTLTLDGVKLIGRGDASVLWALDALAQAIYLRGTGSEVRSLRLTGVRAPKRVSSKASGARIVILGASDFVVDDVTIDTSTSTGVQTGRGATRGTISNNRIRDTLADGIHITGGTSHVTIAGNLIERTGDDGIAIVSYQRDAVPSHDITARRNTVRDNRGGRSMSVVGGANVLFEDNTLSNSGTKACLYLAQEDSWKTQPVRNVTARHNTLTNCGSPSTGHAAVMLFGSSFENTGVRIERNDIMQDAPSRQSGIRMFGLNSGVTIDANRIRGARRELVLPGSVSATPWSAGAVGAR